MTQTNTSPNINKLQAWLTALYLYPAIVMAASHCITFISEHHGITAKLISVASASVFLFISVILVWLKPRSGSLIALFSAFFGLTQLNAVPFASLCVGALIALMLHSRIPAKSNVV